MKIKLKKYLFPLLLTLGLLPSLSAQKLRKDMISTLGGSNQVQNSNLTMQQSIGQASVIGPFTHATTTLAQGFFNGIHPLQKSPEAPFDVLVFPNSFSSHITFKFLQTNRAQTHFSIYDLNGKKVYNKRLIPIDNVVQLNLEQLQPGIYLTYIQTGNRIIQKRILKVD